MKKLLIALLISCMCVLAAGCSSADGKATVSNAKDVVLSVDDKNFTKQDFYNALIGSNAEGVVVSKLTDMIYDSQIGDATSIQEEAHESVESFKELYGEYSEAYLGYYGYGSFENYESVLVTSLKLEALAKAYIEVFAEDLAKEAQPKKIQVIEFTNTDDATTALNAVKSGKTMEEAAAEFDLKVNDSVVSAKTKDVPEGLADVILSTTSTGVAEGIYSNDDASKHYVISFTEVDASKIDVQELLTVYLNDEIIKEDTVLAYYAVQGNFTIYDETLYNAFLKDYPAYLGK